MSTTPEGRVKDGVKAVLAKYDSSIHVRMPVLTGYGKRMLDFVGCFHGLFFSIETKAPGKEPNARQEGVIEEIIQAGGKVFVIDGDMGELERWLAYVDRIYSGDEQ